MSARILIVTPTLGLSPYLEESVASVRRLKLDVHHVLSVPAAKVAEMQERFPHSQVVADAGREGGIYGAINAALQAVPDGWDWFTYINDDDLLERGFTRVVKEHLLRHDPEPVVYGDVRLIDDEGQMLGFLTTERNPKFIPAMLHQRISPLNQQGMLFRRDVCQKVGSFDLQYRLCADLDFWAHAYSLGYAFRYYPREVARFRIRQGQLSGDIHLTRAEFTSIVTRRLPGRPSRIRLVHARLRYRLYNLPRYLRRFTRVGLKSSEGILAGGGA